MSGKAFYMSFVNYAETQRIIYRGIALPVKFIVNNDGAGLTVNIINIRICKIVTGFFKIITGAFSVIPSADIR